MKYLFWAVMLVGFFWIVGRYTQSTKGTARPLAKRNKEESSAESFEGTFYEAEKPRTAKRTINIIYVDARGDRTSRTITIHAYEPTSPQGMLRATCHLRKEQRTFRFDRIEKAVDAETGEILRNLQSTLNEDWKASPESVVQKLMNEQSDLLKLMFYMAKADGAARMAEVEIITTHCQELSGRADLTVQSVKDMLQLLDLPTIAGFTHTYEKMLREQPDLAMRSAIACRAIVATQKTVHQAEQKALDVFEKPENKIL